MDQTNPFDAPAPDVEAVPEVDAVDIGIVSLFQAMGRTIAHDPATVLFAVFVCSLAWHISTLLILPVFRSAGNPSTPSDWMGLMVPALVGTAVWFLLLFGTTRICVAAHRGEDVHLLDVLSELSELPRAGLTALIVYFGILVGVVACIGPGIYILSGLGIAYVVSLIEGQWVLSALRISHQRTRGHKRMVSGVLVAAFCLSIGTFMAAVMVLQSKTLAFFPLLGFHAFVPLLFSVLYSMTAPQDLTVTRT